MTEDKTSKDTFTAKGVIMMLEEIKALLEKNERTNSYHFGPAKNRHKLYYATPTHLQYQLKELREMGLVDEEQLNDGRLKNDK